MAFCPKSKSIVIWQKIITPVGWLKIEACDNGIHHLSSVDTNDENFNPNIDSDVRVDKTHQGTNDLDGPLTSTSPNEPIHQSVQWLRAYFKEPEVLPSLPPICLPSEKSTEFERKVWTTLAETVPFGVKLSYRELAEKIGNPNASRAVGTALKKNPVGLVIPCHRVIRSDGKTGNYAGGTRNKVKQWLLEHEDQNRVNSAKDIK